MKIEKYPRRLENLNIVEGYSDLRFCVVRLSLGIRTKPNTVTARTVSFK